MVNQLQNRPNDFDVDNPYIYWRAAQEYEQAGDLKGAEVGYKAAVLAADNLPLAEYRRNFQDELSKHMSIPGYLTPPGIGPNELKAAYAELLTLPFAARVKLASFFARQDAATEAMQMCRSAMDLKIDDWIMAQDFFLDLRQQLDMVIRAINSPQTRRQQQIPQQLKISQRLGNRTQRIEQPQSAKTVVPRTAPSYNLPDISAMWEAHLQAEQAASLRDIGMDDPDEPLSCDHNGLAAAMHGCLKRFIDELPSADKKRLGVVISEPIGSQAVVRSAHIYGESAKSVPVVRFHACTVLSTLAVSAWTDRVEVHVVPTRDVLKIGEIETEDCLHSRYRLQRQEDKLSWMADGYPLFRDELKVTLRKTFKELLTQASEFLSGGHASLTVAAASGLAKKVSELDQERTNLVEKIVYQQEMVQNRIARDIHDSVIADILALKRGFEAHTINEQQVTDVLQDVSQRLRNICSDLAPRDLQDWGLQTVVKDMSASVGARLKAKWTATVAPDLADLPHQVSLHIYRIVQECLNNMEKHSRATEFSVEISNDNGMLLVLVQDNGVGFDVKAKDMRKASQGGMGLDSIRERVELIRCFYPAQLWIQSQPGAGTKTTLQINTRASQ